MPLLLALLACTPGVHNDAFAPTGEITAHDKTLVVSDADRGSVWTQVLGREGMAHELSLLGEPGRMARAGQDVWVVLRASGELARLRLSHGSLSLEERAFVGAEPFDVELGPSGTVFVSLSQEGAVVQVDRGTLETVRRWQVGGEPRWLQVADSHRGSGPRVFVARADEAVVMEVQTKADTVLEHAVPVVSRFADPTCINRLLEPRITGGFVADSGPGTLYVPVAYFDTQLIEDAENLRPECRPGVLAPAYYAPAPTPEQIIDRMTPTVVVMETEVEEPGRVIPMLSREGNARGLPGDVLLTRSDVDERFVTVPFVNERIQATVSVDAADPVAGTPLWFAPVVQRDVAHGTHAWTYSNTQESVVGWGTWGRALVEGPVARGNGVRTGAVRFSRLVDVVTPLADDVVAGRSLFNSAFDGRVVANRAGMSCSACHADSRTDGLTWQFEDFPRQTPSVAGGVADRVPLTWLGNVPTVEEEALATSRIRMGGNMTSEHASEVAAYLDTVRPVVRPPASPSVDDAIALGEEVFHRPEVGCATCHSGDKGSDGEVHAVFGFEEKTATPHLTGVGATAPYLHDGSEPSLMAVLRRARDGSMGDTSSLTEEEMAALVTYLRRW